MNVRKMLFAVSLSTVLLPYCCAQVVEGTEPGYAIAIHGGAGGDPSTWSAEYQQQRLDSLSSALDTGTQLLEQGTSALDVVESVIRVMEDDPLFNAGRGCVLNENGEHELDASIMDGQTLACGAVGSVKQTKHPISLARKVMTETRHVLLIGNGADEFGQALGLERAEASYFQTERQRDRWARWKASQSTSQKQGQGQETYFGTVGCVVRDAAGNLAAGTSTGGLMGKRWGRVGDSPIIGAGNYADNGTCAVSCTGIGEEFIRRHIASDIAARMRYAQLPLAEAASASLSALPENAGGVISVDHHGNIAVEFNTVGMSYASYDRTGKKTVRLQ